MLDYNELRDKIAKTVIRIAFSGCPFVSRMWPIGAFWGSLGSWGGGLLREVGCRAGLGYGYGVARAYLPRIYHGKFEISHSWTVGNFVDLRLCVASWVFAGRCWVCMWVLYDDVWVGLAIDGYIC